MKTIEIKASNTEVLFNSLQKEIGGELKVILKEYVLLFNNELGIGTVRGMGLPNGIAFIQFDAEFKENIKISINSPKNSIINFMYCNQGELAHSFGLNEKNVGLETYQTGISANIRTYENILYFQKAIRVDAVLISVNSLSINENECSINSLLFKTFIKDREDNYLFLGSFNLKIANYINQLNAVKQEGVVRLLLIEGLVNLILALEVEQHKTENNTSIICKGNLKVFEINAIRELSEYINTNPDLNLSVKEWSAKIGVRSSKVQEGFKLMHGKTLNEYVRYVRVKKSEELIKTTDLNISEIVYSLGLSSRSYFSYIFKNMYNCSPSEYMKKNRLAATA